MKKALEMHLEIDYQRFKRPSHILLTTAVVIMTYNILIYFHPSNQGWIGDESFEWANFLRFIFLEQFAMETITIAILFALIRKYAQWQKLDSLELSPKVISTYLLMFLPILLVAFFFFNPFTQTARFLLNEVANYSPKVYFKDYLFNFNLYPVYLVPVFLGGYGMLIINLILLYNQQLGEANENILQLTKPPRYIDKLSVQDDWGEIPLSVNSVIRFEKEDRKYFAHARNGKFRTKETLSELESSLDPDKFVRVNRSVIVNIAFILNYSFWENEKYVLRLKDDKQTEFIMSRDRLKKVKSQLNLK